MIASTASSLSVTEYSAFVALMTVSPLNVGRFRAPEEYAYEPETEKIDVYSMGNIVYILLTAEYPFEKMKREDMYEAIQKGERPEIKSLAKRPAQLECVEA